ncbi:MAG: type 4a pilus biogenesis protein PilO [Patescibacteria group bacterium]|nr:type 4a pilus biogenesis protein PilO [Patescibacteria group bacterium]
MRNYISYIVIFLLISVLIAFFLILPEYRNFLSLKQEVFKKEAEIKSQEEYFQDIEKISEELNKYQLSLSKIESAIPQDRSLPEVLGFFQKAASQAGLIVERVSPTFTSSDEIEGIKLSRVNLVLEGTYSGLKNFLSIIEKSSRLVEVDNIFFTSPEKKDLFTFNIAVSIFSH